MNQLKRRDKIMIAVLGSSVALMSAIDVGLMKYFTDVLGVSSAIFGRVLSILAIVTVFNNIFSGILTDKLNQYTRVIKIAIPLIAFFATSLLFIQGSWNKSLIFIVLLAIMLMYDFIKIIFNMNYVAYMLNVATDTKDRAEVSAYSKYLGFIPAGVNSLVPILMFTGGFRQQTIMMVFLLCVVIGFVVSLIALKSIRLELVKGNEKEDHITFKDMAKTIKSVAKSKVFTLYYIMIILVNGVTAVYYNMYMYYMENVMNAKGMMAALPDILGAGVQIIIYALTVKAIARMGSRDTLRAGLFITIICYVGLVSAKSYIVVTALYAISMVGFAVFWIIQLPLLGTIIDLDELKTGKRKSGTILALGSIVNGVGLNIMTAIFSFSLEYINYDGEATVQAAETVKGLRMIIGLMPAGLLLLGVIILSFLPLNRKRELEIEQQIKEKHDETGDVIA